MVLPKRSSEMEWREANDNGAACEKQDSTRLEVIQWLTLTDTLVTRGGASLRSETLAKTGHTTSDQVYEAVAEENLDRLVLLVALSTDTVRSTVSHVLPPQSAILVGLALAAVTVPSVPIAFTHCPASESVTRSV